jgi:hypothetical protein
LTLLLGLPHRKMLSFAAKGSVIALRSLANPVYLLGTNPARAPGQHLILAALDLGTGCPVVFYFFGQGATTGGGTAASQNGVKPWDLASCAGSQTFNA